MFGMYSEWDTPYDHEEYMMEVKRRRKLEEDYAESEIEFIDVQNKNRYSEIESF